MKRCIPIKDYTEGWRDGSVGHKDLHSNVKCVLVTPYWGLQGRDRQSPETCWTASLSKVESRSLRDAESGQWVREWQRTGRIHPAFSAPRIFTQEHTHSHACTTHKYNTQKKKFKNLCICNGDFLNSEEEFESNPNTHLLGKQDATQAGNRTETSGYTE